MSPKKWDETKRIWQADHGLLDDRQIEQCARADEADGLRSPIPTRMVSNGEYLPIAQTPEQRRVETRIEELSEEASRRLGTDRRRFLAGTGGMAAALVAMNEVYGRHFGEHRPARSTVAAAGLPRGVKVEIECVAKVG